CLVCGQAKTTLTTTTQVTHQSRMHEPVDRMERLGRIAVPEVLTPATQVAIDLADQRRQRLPPPARSGHVTQALAQSGHGLLRWKHVQVLVIATTQVAVVAERE